MHHHSLLADYFLSLPLSRRVAEELPWHLSASGRETELKKVVETTEALTAFWLGSSIWNSSMAAIGDPLEFTEQDDRKSRRGDGREVEKEQLSVSVDILRRLQHDLLYFVGAANADVFSVYWSLYSDEITGAATWSALARFLFIKCLLELSERLEAEREQRMLLYELIELLPSLHGTPICCKGALRVRYFL